MYDVVVIKAPKVRIAATPAEQRLASTLEGISEAGITRLLCNTWRWVVAKHRGRHRPHSGEEAHAPALASAGESQY